MTYLYVNKQHLVASWIETETSHDVITVKLLYDAGQCQTVTTWRSVFKSFQENCRDTDSHIARILVDLDVESFDVTSRELQVVASTVYSVLRIPANDENFVIRPFVANIPEMDFGPFPPGMTSLYISAWTDRCIDGQARITF